MLKRWCDALTLPYVIVICRVLFILRLWIMPVAVEEEYDDHTLE